MSSCSKSGSNADTVVTIQNTQLTTTGRKNRIHCKYPSTSNLLFKHGMLHFSHIIGRNNSHLKAAGKLNPSIYLRRERKGNSWWIMLLPTIFTVPFLPVTALRNTFQKFMIYKVLEDHKEPSFLMKGNTLLVLLLKHSWKAILLHSKIG